MRLSGCNENRSVIIIAKTGLNLIFIKVAISFRRK